MSERRRARALADERGEPCAWFETLYLEAPEAGGHVPWADLVPNPHLVRWLDAHPLKGKALDRTPLLNTPSATRALDVGCGYGDNAAEFACRGYEVTAFDVSAHAVARARARFPSLDFLAIDGLTPPESWRNAFDLVVEIYTLQVLPPTPRAALADRLTELVRPGGTLLIVCRGRSEDSSPPTGLPWPLTRAEIAHIALANHLEITSFEERWDDETPPVRRFVATLKKETASPQTRHETVRSRPR